MSDIAPVMQAPAAPKKPARKPARRKLAKAAHAVDPPPVKHPEFAGITPSRCPDACTSERCIISTTDVCKHPVLAPANGCGPVTLKNREIAGKILKRQKIGD